MRHCVNSFLVLFACMVKGTLGNAVSAIGRSLRRLHRPRMRYQWDWPPLLVPRLIHLYGTFNNFFLLYNAVSHLQFEPAAGLSHLISTQPPCNSEQRWLAANLAFAVAQLSMLAGVWTFLQAELSARNASIDLPYVSELLPRWGVVRLMHSSYAHAFARQRSFLFPAGIAIFATMMFLLHQRGIYVARFITIIHALVYVDAWSCLFTQGYQSAPELIPPILQGIKATPHTGLATLVYLCTHLPLIFTRFAYVLVILPALSVGLLMRFLIVPYTPSYVAQPLPLQPASKEPPTKPFCQVCQNSFLKEIKRGKADGEGVGMRSFPHQRTIRSLRKSALEGCRICVTLWEKICTVQSDWGPSYLFFWEYATSWQSYGTGMLVFMSKWGGNLAQFGVMEVKDEKFAPCSNEDLEDSTGSEKSIARAKGWLEKCVLDHEGCRGGRDDGFRPTRLLYLGDKGRVSLHTQDNFPRTLTWVTLSHCWGGALFIHLQHNNIESFREEIPWPSLPQTFKDAISVARRMGFKYLWIDSLCILQDSKEDWVTESKVMGDIYRNAVLNIAASNAQNSRDGFLYQRNPRTILPELLPSQYQPSEEECQEKQGKEYLVNSPGIVQRFDQLYSRAWVLQESILARRTLDCARDELFWRCDELVASEELPRGLSFVNIGTMCHPSRGIMGTHNEVSSIRSMMSDMRQWEERNKELLESLKLELRGQNAAYLQEIHGRSSPGGLWGSLVEIYSRMSFTYDSDRPIAIAGIVKSFEPFLGEYWAGMWQDLVPGHLAWSIRRFSDLHSSDPSPCYRPSIKRAPSWSWLSLEGPVYYQEMAEYYHGFRGDDEVEHPASMVLAQLLHVEVITTCDIRLRIRAPMVHAKWEHESRDVLTSSLEAIGFKPIMPGLSIVDLHGTVKWRVSQHIQSFFKDVTRFIRLVFDVAEEGKTVRDVELVAIRTRHGMIEGLVLQEVEDGLFTRVGRFHAWQEAVEVFTERHEREFVLA